MKTNVKKALKELQFHTPLRKFMLHRYSYFFNPAELCFLAEQLESTFEVEGNLLELGCAHGATAVFLNKHLEWLRKNRENSHSKTYFCVDTFSGFTESDIQHERDKRGKKDEDYSQFQLNDPRWLEASFAINSIADTRVIKADANEFDYSILESLSFVLLDVDFYLPIKTALEACYQILSPGGTIIVDDCKPNQKWDGAYQAYHEFCGNNGIQPTIKFSKFGIVSRPS